MGSLRMRLTGIQGLTLTCSRVMCSNSRIHVFNHVYVRVAIVFQGRVNVVFMLLMLCAGLEG